jgi:hypothetical protein
MMFSLWFGELILLNAEDGFWNNSRDTFIIWFYKKEYDYSLLLQWRGLGGSC